MKKNQFKKNIVLAKSAGFCFGVNRAVSKVNELINSNVPNIYTFGPIIHNPQVVNDFMKKGVCSVDLDQIHNLSFKDTIVIRSHGVPPQTLEDIKSTGVNIVDATCPFVSKIHRIVDKVSNEGKTVLIAGSRSHPEVIGICGYCRGKKYIFNDANELKYLLDAHKDLTFSDVVIVSQTTFNRTEWENCLKIVKRVCTSAIIFDTICSATLERQSEAKQIAKSSDVMIVIGGKKSSNTSKLRDICNEFCETFLIEDVNEIPFEKIFKANNIGITAGASTPTGIILEVMETMFDELKENETEYNFEEMLEESLKNFNNDNKVKGVVVGIAPNEVYVDVGRKQAGFIPLSELSNDPNAKAEDLVKVGDELDLLIMHTNDQEGTIMLSKKRIDALKGWEEIVKAYETGEILAGEIINLVKGGVIALTKGQKIFIPASLVSERRTANLEDVLKKEVNFRIIEINKNRRRAVGSIKSVLEEEKKKILEKFWEEIEIGKKYIGIVKSLTNYGAFVDIGGIDGLIHISELSWVRIKHPSEVVKEGETVEVYVKDFDKEKGKIALGYKKSEDNPWEIIKRDYHPGDIVDAQIVSITQFGAFARVITGIDGLIHISELSDKRVEKPQDVVSIGDTVKVLIKDIDIENKRVALSIKAVPKEEEEQ